MDNEKCNILEEREGTAIIVGFIIGVSMLALPNSVTSVSRQDGWLSVIIGGLYPLTMSLFSFYYIKIHPYESILTLSKKYLGKLFGTLFNMLFMLQFFVYFVLIISGFSNVFRVYVVPFLTPIRTIIPIILLTIYLSSKGLKVMARMNLITFIFIIVLILTLLTVFQRGNYLNILPVFDSGFVNIVKGSLQSVYAYGGMEAIFLIYPALKHKDKSKSTVLKAAFIVILVYTWITFASIYYLGHRLAAKTLWPVLLVAEGVNLPVINSFRLVFLFLWAAVLLSILTNLHYAIIKIIQDAVKLKNKNNIYWITFTAALYLSLQIENEVQRRDILDFAIPKITIFNFLYVLIIAILMFICQKKKTIHTKP